MKSSDARPPRLIVVLIVTCALMAVFMMGRCCRVRVDSGAQSLPEPGTRAVMPSSEEQPVAAGESSQAPSPRQNPRVRRRIQPADVAPPVQKDDVSVVIRVLGSDGSAASGSEVRLQKWPWCGRGDGGETNIAIRTADSRGEVRVSVPPGEFVASAALGRYAAVSGPHDSRSTRQVVLKMELGVSYSVRPEDDDGHPVPGVHVEVRLRSGVPSEPPPGEETGARAPDGSWLAPCRLRFEALTGDDGVAHFPALPAHSGSCEITTVSEKDGHRAVVTRGRMEAKYASYQGRPRLLEAATFTGRLVSSDGTPLRDIKFIVGRGQQFQARIDDDGTFVVPNAPRRAGSARVWAEGHAVREQSWDPALQGTIDLGEIRLVPNRR